MGGPFLVEFVAQAAVAAIGNPTNVFSPTRTEMRPSRSARTKIPWTETQLPSEIVLSIIIPMIASLTNITVHL